MATILNRLFGAPEERKVSRVAPLIALSGLGRAVWSERDMVGLMKSGFARNAVVYRCVRMVAEAAASIPVNVFRDRDELRGHDFEKLLLRPNPRTGGRDMMEAIYGNLMLSGNAYLEMVADGATPRELYSLRPDRIKVVPGPDGWPEAYEYSASGQQITLRMDGEGIPPLLHLKVFDPLDDHYGMAPLAAAQVALDIHNSASAWNKALLDNSARPSGALVYAAGGNNMTDEQFDRLKDELENAFSGAMNAGRPILLEGGLDWKPLALSPKDMDFMEAKAAAAREIALAFGVPPLLIGLPGDNTYANYAEANRAMWRQTVIPLAKRTLDAMTQWLSPAYGADLRLELELDHIDALAPERDARLRHLFRADFLSVNEKREAVGDGKVAGGEEVSALPPAAPTEGTEAKLVDILGELLRKYSDA